MLEQLTIAMARGDEGSVERMLTPDVRLNHIGRLPVTGVDAVARALTRYGAATTLEISHVLSKGRAGAVDSIVQFGEKRRAFAHVLEFSSARGTKISAITIYSIAIG